MDAPASPSMPLRADRKTRPRNRRIPLRFATRQIEMSESKLEFLSAATFQTFPLSFKRVSTKSSLGHLGAQAPQQDARFGKPDLGFGDVGTDVVVHHQSGERAR
jgi:hypothetical protein